MCCPFSGATQGCHVFLCKSGKNNLLTFILLKTENLRCLSESGEKKSKVAVCHRNIMHSP